jgi:hypothetical protein
MFAGGVSFHGLAAWVGVETAKPPLDPDDQGASRTGALKTA